MRRRRRELRRDTSLAVKRYLARNIMGAGRRRPAPQAVVLHHQARSGAGSRGHGAGGHLTAAIHHNGLPASEIGAGHLGRERAHGRPGRHAALDSMGHRDWHGSAAARRGGHEERPAEAEPEQRAGEAGHPQGDADCRRRAAGVRRGWDAGAVGVVAGTAEAGAVQARAHSERKGRELERGGRGGAQGRRASEGGGGVGAHREGRGRGVRRQLRGRGAGGGDPHRGGGTGGAGSEGAVVVRLGGRGVSVVRLHAPV